jgi:hypothetical protein
MSHPLPWGMVGMLVLVLAAERFVARHEDTRFTSCLSASWRQAGAASRREAAGSAVLCFGDSMVRFGVAPRVIEARTGLPAYNLAPLGGPPSAAYVLLKRALAAGARPRALVVDFAPWMIVVPPRFYVRQWQDLLTPREALDLAWRARDASLFAAVTAGRLLPSYRARGDLRVNLRHALRGESYSLFIARAILPLWRHWRAHRGGQLQPGDGRADREVNPLDFASLLDASPPDPAAEADLRRFFALAAARRIPVYWLLPPFHPKAAALRERGGQEAAFTEFARSWQAQYPNITIVDARRSGYGASVFADSVHLDRDGATALSAALADVLGPSPSVAAGPRRVELPRYQARGAGAPPEGVEPSRIAAEMRGRAARR